MIEFAGGVLEATRWRVFENLVTLASIRSSNDLAREVIDVYFQEEQSPPGTLLVAEEQPGARGRSGREWKAPRGRGIYLTFVRRVPGGEPLSVVPIAVARWTREALKEVATTVEDHIGPSPTGGSTLLLLGSRSARWVVDEVSRLWSLTVRFELQGSNPNSNAAESQVTLS